MTIVAIRPQVDSEPAFTAGAVLTLAIADAKHVLRNWSDADRVTMTAALLAIVEGWQSKHECNAVEAINVAFAVEHGPLIDLTIEITAIDAGKPLPRLMAMLLLDAANKADWLIVALAHRQVAESVANSKRRAGKGEGDDLTKIMATYLGNHPCASNDEVFSHCMGLAEALHPVFEEAEIEGTLEYRPRADSINCVVLDRAAFSKRLHKIRKKIAGL